MSDYDMEDEKFRFSEGWRACAASLSETEVLEQAWQRHKATHVMTEDQQAMRNRAILGGYRDMQYINLIKRGIKKEIEAVTDNAEYKKGLERAIYCINNPARVLGLKKVK